MKADERRSNYGCDITYTNNSVSCFKLFPCTIMLLALVCLIYCGLALSMPLPLISASLNSLLLNEGKVMCLVL